MFYNHDSQAFLELKDYLSENLFSSDSKAFAKEAVKALKDGGEVDVDDNLILSKEFKDNEKLKCVYDKLAGDNSTLFKDIVGAFIDNPNANLIFTIGECNNTDDACTQTEYFEHTGIITIKIEDIQTNPIQLAQYFLHESIHAEITKYVWEYQEGVDPNNRPQLFQLFKYYKELYGDGDIDHIYMTINYINPIAEALRALDNNSYPLDYYKAFAWDGLRVWDADNLLGKEENLEYEGYRSIVIQNSSICN